MIINHLNINYIINMNNFLYRIVGFNIWNFKIKMKSANFG